MLLIDANMDSKDSSFCVGSPTNYPDPFISMEPPPPPPPPPPSLNHSDPPLRLFQNLDTKRQSRLRNFNWEAIPLERVQGRPSLWSPESFQGEMQIDTGRMEELFGKKEEMPTKSYRPRRSLSMGDAQANKVFLLDSRRNMNICIFLKHFKRSAAQIIKDIKMGKGETFSSEKLNELLKHLPEREEAKRLKSFQGDRDQLNEADLFMLLLLEVPSYDLRLEALILKKDFHSVVLSQLSTARELKGAAEELLQCSDLHFILRLVLKAGNFMNAGGYAGTAAGFRVSSLLKLADIKANKPGMNLLHFVVMEVQKKDISFLSFPDRLEHVSTASRLSEDGLREDFCKLQSRVSSMRHSLEEKQQTELRGQMDTFLEYAEDQLLEVQKEIEALHISRHNLLHFLCEDEESFRLEECCKIFSYFCQKFQLAIKENRDRELEEERRQRLEQERLLKRHSMAACNELEGWKVDDDLEITLERNLRYMRKPSGLRFCRMRSLGSSSPTPMIHQRSPMEKIQEFSSQKTAHQMREMSERGLNQQLGYKIYKDTNHGNSICGTITQALIHSAPRQSLAQPGSKTFSQKLTLPGFKTFGQSLVQLESAKDSLFNTKPEASRRILSGSTLEQTMSETKRKNEDQFECENHIQSSVNTESEILSQSSDYRVPETPTQSTTHHVPDTPIQLPANHEHNTPSQLPAHHECESPSQLSSHHKPETTCYLPVQHELETPSHLLAQHEPETPSQIPAHHEPDIPRYLLAQNEPETLSQLPAQIEHKTQGQVPAQHKSESLSQSSASLGCKTPSPQTQLRQENLSQSSGPLGNETQSQLTSPLVLENPVAQSDCDNLSQAPSKLVQETSSQLMFQCGSETNSLLPVQVGHKTPTQTPSQFEPEILSQLTSWSVPETFSQSVNKATKQSQTHLGAEIAKQPVAQLTHEISRKAIDESGVAIRRQSTLEIPRHFIAHFVQKTTIQTLSQSKPDTPIKSQLPGHYPTKHSVAQLETEMTSLSQQTSGSDSSRKALTHPKPDIQIQTLTQLALETTRQPVDQVGPEIYRQSLALPFCNISNQRISENKPEISSQSMSKCQCDASTKHLANFESETKRQSLSDTKSQVLYQPEPEKPTHSQSGMNIGSQYKHKHEIPSQLQSLCLSELSNQILSQCEPETPKLPQTHCDSDNTSQSPDQLRPSLTQLETNVTSHHRGQNQHKSSGQCISSSGHGSSSHSLFQVALESSSISLFQPGPMFSGPSPALSRSESRKQAVAHPELDATKIPLKKKIRSNESNVQIPSTQERFTEPQKEEPKASKRTMEYKPLARTLKCEHSGVQPESPNHCSKWKREMQNISDKGGGRRKDSKSESSSVEDSEQKNEDHIRTSLLRKSVSCIKKQHNSDPGLGVRRVHLTREVAPVCAQSSGNVNQTSKPNCTLEQKDPRGMKLPHKVNLYNVDPMKQPISGKVMGSPKEKRDTPLQNSIECGKVSENKCSPTSNSKRNIPCPPKSAYNQDRRLDPTGESDWTSPINQKKSVSVARVAVHIIKNCEFSTSIPRRARNPHVETHPIWR